MAGAGLTTPSLLRHKPGWDSAAIGGLVVAALTLGFFLLFWNRFSAIRDGNGSIVAAQLVLAGKLLPTGTGTAPDRPCTCSKRRR